MKTSTAVSIGATAALAGAYALVVRPCFLRWGTTEEERRSSYPGDNLTSGGRVTSMRAITINALPSQIWPWIMQIGQDRAGFYSYRQLENAVGAHMPKVERIVPQFQHRYVGDTVWLSDPRSYHGNAKLIVGYYQENRAMVLIAPEDWERVLLGRPIAHGTWGFILEPIEDGKTRLIMRSVSSAPPFSRDGVLSYAWEVPHYIMERRMMKHVKELVERSIAPSVSIETIEIEVEPA